MSWYGEVTMRTIGRGLLGVILLVAVPALPASGGICQFSPCLEESEAPPATQAVAASSARPDSGAPVAVGRVSCQITPCPEAGEAPAIVEAKAAVTSDDGLSLSAKAPNSCGEGCWSSGTYAYDGSGNITAIGGDEYRYDLVGRITRGTVVMPDGTTRTQSYAYDSFGNILDRTTDEFQVETSVDSTTNRPKSGLYGAYTWDAAGAMTFSGDSGESYEWDGVGMMTRRSGTRNLTFLYTADDERIAVFENDPSGNPLRATWTLRGLDHKVLRTWTSTGGPYATEEWQWKQDYVYRDGGRLLATVTPDGVRHFHLDHLGTPRVITDAQGVKLAEHTYYPFGVEATDERQNAEVMKFTGHERDLDPHSIHDLDYMHARYYSPVLGRFLSVDPVWSSADIDKPQSWNRYSYVLNRPINLIDPDGRDWQEYAWAIWATFAEVFFDYVLLDGEGLDTEPAPDLTKAAVPGAIVTAELHSDVKQIYKRPSGATTPEQRAMVQGKACEVCGNDDGGKRVAGHKKALVQEHYETGSIDKQKMRAVDSVRPECTTCSAREGAAMSRYSRAMKTKLKQLLKILL